MLLASRQPLRSGCLLYPCCGNFWHLESRSLEYDPDKARALLKQAHAVGTPLKLVGVELAHFHLHEVTLLLYQKCTLKIFLRG